MYGRYVLSCIDERPLSIKPKQIILVWLIKPEFYGIVSTNSIVSKRSYKMSSQSQSADNAYHDPLESFTDRETILTLFKKSLQSVQPGQPRFLALKGNSGTGKTFLIAYMTKYLSSHYHWKSGCISATHADVSDFRPLLAGVEDALKACVSYENLKQYRIKRDDFQRRFDEYCSTVTIGRVEQVFSANGSATISGVSMNFQVTTELHKRERQLRSELTRALIELAEENEHPLCLFIDRYELLVDNDTELLNWLFGELLLPLIAAAPQPIHIVTCGWEWPTDTAIQPFTMRNQLSDFSFEQVRGYLEKQNVLIQTSSPIKQQELISAFSLLTRGHPLVLGLAVTYFKQLDEQERTAERFLQHKSLVNERARVEFLEERLLKRLPEATERAESQMHLVRCSRNISPPTTPLHKPNEPQPSIGCTEKRQFGKVSLRLENAHFTTSVPASPIRKSRLPAEANGLPILSNLFLAISIRPRRATGNGLLHALIWITHNWISCWSPV